ncbi:hypothetical protein AC579_5496 [Pseudocercospora musae]|uniref:Major facilitator superfamily (MFS) profile domain-containing protein n=1 Tax=Pseudocercospora musae TaxID=113226 RepID=A0A139IQ84_9PEZI|nr:hypothetical protein AC579_5496 [Pseudocercospora musae]
MTKGSLPGDPSLDNHFDLMNMSPSCKPGRGVVCTTHAHETRHETKHEEAYLGNGWLQHVGGTRLRTIISFMRLDLTTSLVVSLHGRKMSQDQARDEIGSHPLLQSRSQTPVQTPARDASTPPVRHATTTPTRLSTNQRSAPDSATPQRSLQLQEKAYEHDLHADLHWTINPYNPKNWTKRKKWIHTLLFCATSWTIMLGASSLTLAHDILMHEFHTSSIISVLPTSLHLLGLVLGILVTPNAESMGRKSMYLLSAPLYAIFILASGLTKSMSGLAICRLLGGLVAASVLQLGYASILDIWPAEKRVVPIAAYTSTIPVGSALGSVLSGAIVWRQHWRWTQFAILIPFGLFYGPMFFTDETLKPMILRKSRKETSNISLIRGFDKNESLRRHLIPFSEPLALLCGVLNAFHFGVLFAILTAFPDILSGTQNFDAGAQGLTFLAMSVGALLALAMELCHQQWCYKPRAFRYKEEKVSEEERTLYTGKRASKYSSRTSFTSNEQNSVGRSSRRSALLQSLKRLSIPIGKTFEQTNPEWRRNMKLAYAATGYVNGIDENCGRRIKPEKVNHLLDQKLDFSQLCTALEGHKLKFDRVELARVLAEALADETQTPATYPSSANNEDVERHRLATASALESTKPETTPKPSINEKLKTWIPPSTLPPPEWRLWLALPASALNVASLFILGWTTHDHWIATVIAMAMYAFGSSLVAVSTTLYVLECFDSSRNEAVWAGSSMLMYSSGFVFSLFAIEELKLGAGLGMSVYAILGVFFGLIPAVLYAFGPALRKRRESRDSK